jgi:hypothetical protein
MSPINFMLRVWLITALWWTGSLILLASHVLIELAEIALEYTSDRLLQRIRSVRRPVAEEFDRRRVDCSGRR